MYDAVVDAVQRSIYHSICMLKWDPGFNIGADRNTKLRSTLRRSFVCGFVCNRRCTFRHTFRVLTCIKQDSDSNTNNYTQFSGFGNSH